MNSFFELSSSKAASSKLIGLIGSSPDLTTLGPAASPTLSRSTTLTGQLLAPFEGKPNLNYLEIGTSEGRATFWMLENILTHPSCRATGIDPFLVEGHEQRFRENLATFGQPEKVRVIKGFSQDVLPTLAPASYDIIYIDASYSYLFHNLIGRTHATVIDIGGRNIGEELPDPRFNLTGIETFLHDPRGAMYYLRLTQEI